jgi:hypothetical protein
MDITNEKWKPSQSYWFNKYTCCITLGPFKKSRTVFTAAPPNRSRCTYLFDDNKREYQIYSKIYTSDLELIKGLMNMYPYIEVMTPMNEAHELYLTQERFCIREKQWYGQYKYKVDSWIPWLARHNKEETPIEEINKFIDNNFQGEARIRRSFGWGYNNVPYLYTNNEGAIMLYKLMFGNVLNITVTEAVTFDEIKEQA